jgi:hypothetical protein
VIGISYHRDDHNSMTSTAAISVLNIGLCSSYVMNSVHGGPQSRTKEDVVSRHCCWCYPSWVVESVACVCACSHHIQHIWQDMLYVSANVGHPMAQDNHVV